MQFQKLRISGFKSFVDPVEFRIEPGLTGVVGPNGCGKSNLLEALRWVMGATSAKAMRADGMDDVIFAGASARASRSHAEVMLVIDNSDRTAPAQFNSHAVLEVTRRIDRGAGSTYRVNGAETRARDVQLLFADASTGANSPSLVRQGQISELIAAKPSNRRRILEEAAGVSGLHSRRHEAELRLRAAEANLDRLDDVTRELEQTLGRLRREARQAEKYRKLSAEIRSLQGAALISRWQEARTALDAARGVATASEEALATTTTEAAKASAAAATASEQLKPLRKEEAVAAAVLQRLALERDRIERDLDQAKTDLARIVAEAQRTDQDRALEEERAEDAAASVARLQLELDTVTRALAEAPERLPDLEADLAKAILARERTDAEIERLAGLAAAAEARKQAARQRLEDAERALRVQETRAEEARSRVARAERGLTDTTRERASLSLGESPDGAAAKAKLAQAEAQLATARDQVESLEAARADAQMAEADAREDLRQAQERATRLKAEGDALTSLTRSASKTPYPPALNQISPQRGYEAALAAALGDDLDAALDVRAPNHWAGATARQPDWPEGASPLSAWVTTPPELSARLAMTALTTREDGLRLQKLLPVGARLVSVEGDLWRWDGLVTRAEAEKPAARRLAQKARLEEVTALAAAEAPIVAALGAAHAVAVERARSLDASLRDARRAPVECEREVRLAREAVERYARETARAEARAQSLDETLQRFQADLTAARSALVATEADWQTALAAVEAARADAPQPANSGDAEAAALAAARRAGALAREAELAARGRVEAEIRAKEGRTRRRDGLARDLADWQRRDHEARARIDALLARRAALEGERAEAAERPVTLEAKRLDLTGEHFKAEARRTAAADQLAEAEAQLKSLDRAVREADEAAAMAREARAAALARQEAAFERLTAAADRLRETARMEPLELAAKLAEDAIGVPSDAAGVEQLLRDLEKDRDALGAVNLRADEEATEHALRLDAMRSERSDLVGAIARLRAGIEDLNGEGRERLMAAFSVINEAFKALFKTLFDGGEAELRLVENEDPLEAGLEIYACPPGKRLATMSLMSGGEQALTATALIFAVFLANPSPICVLEEVDAPLDDANVDRFCRLLNEMRQRTQTRFIAITHNPVTMSRMDRLFGVTMPERGISQMVSVDLVQAERMAAQ